jgi:hypothetical protein
MNETTYTTNGYTSTMNSISKDSNTKYVRNIITRDVLYSDSTPTNNISINLTNNTTSNQSRTSIYLTPETIELQTGNSREIFDPNNINLTSSVITLNSRISKTLAITLNSMLSVEYDNNVMFYIVPRSSDVTKCDFTVNGKVIADNVSTSMTITHETDVTDYNLGSFCETTGLIYSNYEKVGITDCITGVKVSTTLSVKILGIITDNNQFASHGDVLVKVVDGEYHLGDLLVPTENGARVATDDEKMFICLNGLPKVRVMSITDNRIPKIDNQVCVAAFIS